MGGSKEEKEQQQKKKTSSCQQEPFSLAEDVSTRKTERIFEIEMIKFNGKAAHSLDKSLSAVFYTPGTMPGIR